MSEMKTPWTTAFEPSGHRWITSVASQPILLPPMHQAGQTHCNLAWLRTMACNKLWRNSTHSLEASSQSQKDWGLGNFRRLCFQSSSPFCWSSVPEYLVDHPPWIQSSHTLMELGAGTLFSLWPEGLSNVIPGSLYGDSDPHKLVKRGSSKELRHNERGSVSALRQSVNSRHIYHRSSVTKSEAQSNDHNALLSPFSVLWERNNNNAW